MLLFAAVLLAGIAQKARLPYPIALVLAGAAIGFIPGLNAYFNPNLILVIVLPPILYYGAFGIPFREFKKNWRAIFSLALGLVVFTTIIIAILFKWLFPQFPWALAFTFGAIISPPDATAATTILKRFSINSRLISLLEGESLINDASAIVLYKLAVTALLSGTFSLMGGGFDFIQVVAGGIIVGFVLGFIFQLFSKYYLEPVLGAVFSFTIPYVTYIVANLMDVSGVLAVVVNGMIGSRVLLTHHSSLRRVLGFATWDIFIILLNCFVFILIGLQLKTLTSMMTTNQIFLYSFYALFFSIAMAVIRIIWVYAKAGIAYIRALKSTKSSTLCPEILREAVLIGWSGMRGIVSLAIALALPVTLPNGLPLEGRNEVIFVTFVVILITLLVPGLTLPTVIRWLKIQPLSKKYNESKIRERLAKIAEEKLYHLLNTQSINKKEFDLLQAYFISQQRLLELYHGAEERGVPNSELARHKVIQAQRKELMTMWEQQEIDDHLLTHLEGELDIQEVHLARGELK